MTFKEYPDRETISKNITILQIVTLIIFVFFAFSFYSIQIIQNKYYLDKAENNKLQIQEISAPRGLIYDRNGQLLADNKPSFSLKLNRSLTKKPNDSLGYLSTLLYSEKQQISENFAAYANLKYNVSLPILNNLSIGQVSLIEARRYEHPEFSIQTAPERYYPFAELASHIIGYVGSITREQLDNEKYEDVKFREIIGQYGIEAYYDNYLRGKNGEEYDIVNSIGYKVGELKSMRKDPEPGQNVILTIDIKLQELLAKMYQDKKGAAVVIQPGTGEILALWSSPSFNANYFIPKISKQQWEDYNQDTNLPLVDKAIQGRYSPGSVFKLVIALTALIEKKITPGTQFFCPGAAQIYGHTYHCWSSGHGWQDLKGAITHSCDVYFYNVAKLLNIDTIAAYAHKFGLGRNTMIDLNNEVGGLIPDSHWKIKTTGTPWYPGETISVGVGQGPISITPIQMANLISFIANGGKIYYPHFLKAVITKDNKVIQSQPKLFIQEHINPSILNVIKDALWSVVNAGGTGGRTKIPGLDICGKTGTVELLTNKELLKKNPELKIKYKEHAWFVGYASKDKPEIALVIFVEHGGHGGETAAPMAKEIFKYYFKLDNVQIIQTESESQTPAD